MEFLPPAFAGMGTYHQFILFQLVPNKTRQGKFDKIPIDHRTMRPGSAHDSAIWLSADDAIAKVQNGDGYGIGFVFTKSDPFFFIDIDNCLQIDNTWNATAHEILALFPGAAIEVSSSGRGLHIFGTATVGAHACKNIAKGVEFYTDGRFVALTGMHASGNVLNDFSGPVANFIQLYDLLPKQAEHAQSTEWTHEPVADWNGTKNNDELIARMLRSKSTGSMFGDRASFKDLWEKNVEVLAKAYPDDVRDYDESSADAALAQHLAFWTGNDCERIRGLMMLSALSREKWEREDYLRLTILGACRRQTVWLRDLPEQNIQNSVVSQLSPKAVRRIGSSFATIEFQEKWFQGCIYVSDEHRALIPGGSLLNEGRFRAWYSGYSFVMDGENGKTTNNAWEAFTESRALIHPRADSSTFKPNADPGTIIEKDGRTFANIYWPVLTPRTVGDATPFLNHLKLVLPDERDQQILLGYMAAIVQFKGVKFQWCPLIQGVEGNGKTLFTNCVAFAIGNAYSHFPKASEIAAKFNDWLYGKIFIGVEDIYVHDSQREVMEILKPMITGERQEIEPKGGAKVTKDICANFLINTNHRDGLRKTRNDRRFAPLYCQQQSLADLKSCHMLGNYFPRLYAWLREGGYAIVSELLHTYPIPLGFNPVLIDRAPITSSTELAIEQSRGGIEQEIEEAIAQGAKGFRGGWVSSMALDGLLSRIKAGAKVQHKRRKAIMEDLGYIYHPALTDGRATRVLEPDNGKPRLYIKIDSPHLQLVQATDVYKQYVKDQ